MIDQFYLISFMSNFFCFSFSIYALLDFPIIPFSFVIIFFPFYFPFLSYKFIICFYSIFVLTLQFFLIKGFIFIFYDKL